MNKKVARYIPITVFLTMIFLLTIMNFLKPEKAFSEGENRYLASKPEFSFLTLVNGKYTEDVEEYITDQFIWRDEFIGTKAQTEHLLLKQDTNGVYFADDGYLIEKHDISKIDVNLLDRNIKRLYEFMESTSKKLGNDHVFAMLVPTASNILDDKLPPYTTQFDQIAMIENIKSNMNYGKFIDLRSILKENKQEYIYYKTDHHWTTKGAYYGYRQLCDASGVNGYVESDFNIKPVTNKFYGTLFSKARLYSTKPDTMNAYMPKFDADYKVEYNMGEKTTDTLYEKSYLAKRDSYSYYLGGNNPVVKITSNDKNGKKLLIIKDSFGHSFAPFVANDYSEVHMLDLRYINMSISEYIEKNGITDTLVLYNTINFATEKTIVNLNI